MLLARDNIFMSKKFISYEISMLDVKYDNEPYEFTYSRLMSTQKVYIVTRASSRSSLHRLLPSIVI